MPLIIARPTTIPASAVVVTPVGDVAGIDGQTALGELAVEKVAVTSGREVPKLWRGTQAEYDALTKEDGVVYFVLPDADSEVVAIFIGRTGGAIPSGSWNFSTLTQSGHLLTIGF
jgi:hypothetical protein